MDVKIEGADPGAQTCAASKAPRPVPAANRLLGGIGFTMSIFITNLAFVEQPDVINSSKMAILVASFAAGAIGFVWLKLAGTPPIRTSIPRRWRSNRGPYIENGNATKEYKIARGAGQDPDCKAHW